jgi:hypothetical protein
MWSPNYPALDAGVLSRPAGASGPARLAGCSGRGVGSTGSASVRRAGRSQPISATRGAIFSATCWANSTGWRSGISSISATPSSA